jgi:hypothetical protein
VTLPKHFIEVTFDSVTSLFVTALNVILACHASENFFMAAIVA